MAILEKGKYKHQIPTQNPFVLAVHHLDYFPEGNDYLGPAKKLEQTGYDMDADWRMYYGEDVPGFPAHPHRGFETITVVTKGVVDHTDGLGSKGRYENGDVQWMTAGRGLQHCEMFPLIHKDKANTMELFQIWLSLDRAHRMVEPDYKMLWREDIPVIRIGDIGRQVKITLIAGELNGIEAVKPTKDSWAYDKKNRVSIQLIEFDEGASYELPIASGPFNRSIYQYEGGELHVGDEPFNKNEYMFISADETILIKNKSGATSKILLLESEPINEPIVAYGPFVMTTNEEISQAYIDYKRTEFGGWPFEKDEVVHERNEGRFAAYPDGRIDRPTNR